MRVRFRYRFAAGAQRTVCRVVLFFLFRALNALPVRDSRVAAEIAPWPEERVLGLEVPHAHVHLVPLQQEGDMNFSNPKKHFPDEEMAACAEAIRAHLAE